MIPAILLPTLRPLHHYLMTLAVAGSAAALIARPGASATAAARPAAIVKQMTQQDFTALFPQPAPSAVDGSAELFVTLAEGDTLQALLERTGVQSSEAATAIDLVGSALPSGLSTGTELAIVISGAAQGRGRVALDRLSLRTPVDHSLSIVRTSDGRFRLEAGASGPFAAPERFSGLVDNSLYWSMRSAGVPGEAADEFVNALSEGAPGIVQDAIRFDLILSAAPRANGAEAPPRLLYAAVARQGAPPVRLVKWVVGGSARWIDLGKATVNGKSQISPLSGRISSTYGSRAHPILRLLRFHRGIDIAAPAGTPILASADGQVASAGWSGGHGQRVQLIHPDGLETSYSHMSRIAAEPGTRVRQGEVIGYVGSTGLSTGPHLHFEMRRNGRLIDPQTALAGHRSMLDAGERSEIERHFRLLVMAAETRTPSA